mgnify:FL=1
MKCPIDGTTLVMADRSGVEIDYCPQCRGVWLDRGELDNIIERAVPEVAPAPAPASPPPPEPPRWGEGQGRERRLDDREDRRFDDRDGRRDRDRDDDDDDRRYHKRKKRKNFLEDLFDF